MLFQSWILIVAHTNYSNLFIEASGIAYKLFGVTWTNLDSSVFAN